MTQSAITEILTVLTTNKELLAKDKSSGVHKIDDVYRIHRGSFIPRFMECATTNTEISDAIAAKFSDSMAWDAKTLWLTIYQ